jgi:exopolysaccharide production protein ExoQ
MSFFLLLIVFWLAQPFDFSSSLKVQAEASSSEEALAIVNGSLEREVGLFLLALFAIVSLAHHRHSHLHTDTRLVWPVILFWSWACMSTAWSDDPSLTARKLGVLLILCLAAVAVAKSFSYRNVLRFSFVALLSTLLAGLFSELALRTFHPFEAGYRFAGIMGPMFVAWDCSLLLIAIVALARGKPHRVRLGYTLVFTGVAGFLLLTKTRSALAGALLGLLTYFMLVSSRRRILATVWTAATITCAIFLFGGTHTGAVAAHALLLGRTGDPSTLTGRLPFWEGKLLPYFVKSPIAGYGYDSFWTARRVKQIAPARGWFFPDSHNSLIEIALGLGVIGLVLYITVFATAFGLSSRRSDSSPGCAGPFTSAVLLCSFVNSTMTSVQLHPYLGSFLCLVAIAQIAFSKRTAVGSAILPRRFLVRMPASACARTERV